MKKSGLYEYKTGKYALLLMMLLLIGWLSTTSNATNKKTYDPTNEKPDDNTFNLPFNVPPPVIEPQLCKELRNKVGNASEMEISRIEQLLNLCKKPQNKTLITHLEHDHLHTVRKRSSSKTKFKKNEQKMLLDLHNRYRRSVKPTAANMKLMKWDPYLADTAQSWAEGCIFEHGMPKEVKAKSELLGQNLYVGNDPTGYRAMEMWFEEIDYYDYDTTECDPDELCGHYLQVTWADTEYVGCGKAKCVEHGYYIACHYRPHGNVPDVSPFIVGKPCSQCHSKTDGGLCYNKTCVTNAECKTLKLDCSCDLKCYNCASLRKAYCRCVCKNGWDSLDCSRPCMDSHYYCLNDPGWPDMLSCNLENHKVRDLYCRKMCKQCKRTEIIRIINDSSNVCCEGKECDGGFVLSENCECKQLCPGPKCLIEPVDQQNRSTKISVTTEEVFKETESTNLDQTDNPSHKRNNQSTDLKDNKQSNCTDYCNQINELETSGNNRYSSDGTNRSVNFNITAVMNSNTVKISGVMTKASSKASNLLDIPNTLLKNLVFITFLKLILFRYFVI